MKYLIFLKLITENDKILDNVVEVSKYLESELDKLVDEFDVIKTRRGKGLMQGLVVDGKPGDYVTKALENGLIVISAGSDVLRFVPPLIITKENVDEMISIMRKVLA